jgi:DNA-directed RNA polymerase specialized sigma24 family protein
MNLDAVGLLNIALEKTLQGVRHWKPDKVDFIGHLFGVIKSDVSHHGDKVTRGRPIVSSAADFRRVDDDGRASDPVEDCAGDAPTPERQAAARERLEALADLFADDDEVTLVMEGLADEMTGPEIQDALEISKTEYETIMKRMRRKARALDRQGGTHV